MAEWRAHAGAMSLMRAGRFAARLQARRARPSDEQPILGLVALLFREMGLDGDAWRAEAGRAIRTRGRNRAVFVAEVQDIIVACGAVSISWRYPGPTTPDGRVAYVNWMVTAPAHRRRGYGRAVLEALLDWVEARGVRMTELYATEEGYPLYTNAQFGPPPRPFLRRLSRLHPPDSSVT